MKVATVEVSEAWDHGQEVVTARLLRGSRGQLGEIVRVRGPVERRADVVWRATIEGIDRGFEVREGAR